MHKLAAPTLMAALMATGASATTAIGLAGDRTLVSIDLDTAQVTGMQDVDYDGRILGIDFRPSTGMIIAVTDQFAVVNIDPDTGAWDEVVTMDTPLEHGEGDVVIVDINPAADALRFMSGTTNHRVNLGSGAVMVDGSLSFTDGTDGMPMVGGTAYSNSHGQPESTMMFNIDISLASLLQQTAPNDGDNVVIGATGATFDGPVAFDIATTTDGENTAWLVANGAFHSIDLSSGMITQTWQIGALDVVLRDVTVFHPAD
ncbi:DUF4394 domain-containing protein [Roseinatronobacter alkalisoli]|uniref:DUF4394 domain-containing protein n=1 Tax=Roseinatronobacter alkalisoli TaxID=3028235 RepID=A0ABT5T833_9RHOB|nr:DUF4394 domain-containing protein [Roseinatronobacter sp. HJB301]MDD7971287.1 DUF4394 domain-containing protein [Roseinatronobacter sp. HJB301]